MDHLDHRRLVRELAASLTPSQQPPHPVFARVRDNLGASSLRALRAFAAAAEVDPVASRALSVAPAQTLRRAGLRAQDRSVVLGALDAWHRYAMTVRDGRTALDAPLVEGIYLGGDPPTSSVLLGGSLRVHVTFGYRTYGDAEYRIYDLTAAATPTLRARGPLASLQFDPPDPYNAPEAGFPWPYVGVSTDPSWPSGIYAVQVVAAANQDVLEDSPLTAVFAVRHAPPRLGEYAKFAPPHVVMCVPLSTRNAYSHSRLASKDTDSEDFYNSLYDWAQPRRTRRVSLLRTSTPGGGGGWSRTVDAHCQLWRLLAQNNVALDACTSYDLHWDPKLLDPYNLVVFAGHDEYWSKEMRDNVESFVARGGNAAFFSGNACWGQIRFEDGGKTMVCYKSSLEDPLAGRAPQGDRDAEVSGLWPNSPTDRPENTLTGLSTRRGAIYDFHSVSERSFTVVSDGNDADPDPSRRALTQAFMQGLSRGSPLGFPAFESDGLDFTVTGASGTRHMFELAVGALDPNANYEVTGVDGTPLGFKILAVADLRDADRPGWAVVGYYTNVGTVFSAGTTDWALSSDPNVQSLTVRVVTELSKRTKRPAWTLPPRPFPSNVAPGGPDPENPRILGPPRVYPWELLQSVLRDADGTPIHAVAITASSLGHLLVLDTEGALWRVDPEAPSDAWASTHAPALPIGSHARAMGSTNWGERVFATRWDGQSATNELVSIPTIELLASGSSPAWSAKSNVPAGECLGVAYTGPAPSSPGDLFLAMADRDGHWLYKDTSKLARWPATFKSLGSAPWEGRLFATDGAHLYTRETVAVDLAWRKVCAVPVGTYAIAVYHGVVYALAGALSRSQTSKAVRGAAATGLWWRALVKEGGFREPCLLFLRKPTLTYDTEWRHTHGYAVVGELAANGDYRALGEVVYPDPNLGPLPLEIDYSSPTDAGAVARVGPGLVFFLLPDDGGYLVRIGADLTWTALRTWSAGSFRSPADNPWTRLVHVDTGRTEHVIFYDETSGYTIIGRFDPKTYDFIEEQRYDDVSDGWTSIAATPAGGYVLFYDAELGQVAYARVADDGGLTTLASGALPAFPSFNRFRPPRAVGVGQTMVLLHEAATGSAMLVDVANPGEDALHGWMSDSDAFAKGTKDATPIGSPDGVALFVKATGEALSWGFTVDNGPVSQDYAAVLRSTIYAGVGWDDVIDVGVLP